MYEKSHVLDQELQLKFIVDVVEWLVAIKFWRDTFIITTVLASFAPWHQFPNFVIVSVTLNFFNA